MRNRFSAAKAPFESLWLPVLGILALAFVLAISSQTARAQVLFGTVTGSVTDPSGAAVPAASVKITEMTTNDSRTVQTNGAGGYTASTLPAGTYQVEITKEGFRGFVTSNILVNQNNEVRVDAQLQVGSQAEKVEVTAEAAALQTDRADVHGEVGSKQLTELPQPTRTYEGLLATVPGISYASSQLSGGTNNPSKSVVFSFNGTGTSESNVRIEGVSSRNPWSTGFTTFVPSIEAIQNVNAATSTADSEQAFASGASVNVMLKSGSNQTHGAAYIYNIDSAFEANNFFANSSGISKPPHLVDNDTGANIGGHIVKDKLFYFGGYEGDYTRSANSGILSFPAQQQLGGDFSASPTPIYNPYSGTTSGANSGQGRTPFPGNIIPQSLFSPVIAKIIPFIPATNIPGVNNNYYTNEPAVYNLHKMDSKADYNATPKLRLSARWGYQPYYSFFGAVYGNTLGGAGPFSTACGACNYLQNGATMGTSASGTYVASPTFIIDATFGVTQGHQLLFPNLTNVRYGSDVLGIPGTNVGPLPWAGGVPNFSISGYVTMGYSYPALEYKDPIFEYTVNATKSKGKHSIRFGMDIQREHQNHIETSPTVFTFSGGPTVLNATGVSAATNNYNNVADFVLGLPTSASNYIQYVQPYLTLRTWEFSLYARDQWQMTRKVTVNYGVRWEYYPVPTQENRGITQYTFATNTTTICGQGGTPMDCGIHVTKRQFVPNIGIAYRMFEKFVVRVGYSISPIQDNMARGAFKSYPDNAAATLAAPAPTSYTYATTMTAGIPIIPAPVLVNGKVIPPPNTGNLSSQNSLNFVRGYIEQYNAAVQKEFAGGWIAQVGYLGTHGVKLNTALNLNYGQLGGGPASQPLVAEGYGETSSVSVNTPYGASKYNAMQSTLSHRYSNGLTLQVAYTYSKYMSLGTGINIPGYNAQNYTRDSSDRTHNLVISGIYELPLGKGRKYLKQGIADAVLGGLIVGSVFSHYSGFPFSIGAATTTANCNCPGSSQRVNQVLPNVAIVGSGVGGQAYFNPLAFQNPTTLGFGNMNNNELRGPGLTNMDANLIRTISITERFKVQLRAEALNLSNTPHFANPGTTLSNMSLNPDGSVKNLGGFSQITATNNYSRLIDPRYFRFGLRLIF